MMRACTKQIQKSGVAFRGHGAFNERPRPAAVDPRARGLIDAPLEAAT